VPFIPALRLIPGAQLPVEEAVSDEFFPCCFLAHRNLPNTGKQPCTAAETRGNQVSWKLTAVVSRQALPCQLYRNRGASREYWEEYHREAWQYSAKDVHL
jgi:hypothetical protein